MSDIDVVEQSERGVTMCGNYRTPDGQPWRPEDEGAEPDVARLSYLLRLQQKPPAQLTNTDRIVILEAKLADTNSRVNFHERRTSGLS